MTEIRFIKPDEIRDFRAAIDLGFGGDFEDEDGADDRFASLFNIETCMAAFDDGRMVSTFGSIDFDLAVPGGAVPMAGTTVVTVHPTHRRQGILTQMMTTHLRQAMDRGQPIAGLWASEAPIYGRFGYGNAAHGLEVTVPSRSVTLPPGRTGITVKMIEHAQAMEVLPPLYEKMFRVTPGMLSRSPDWWQHRRLRDSERHRGGMSARRIVIACEDNRALGYLLYRQKENWEEHLPNGKISIIEVVATDEDARRALWQYITNVDLFPNVEWWNTPVDYPLLVEASSPRALTVKQSDTMWLRILDVPACLESRTYESDGRIVIAVTDRLMDCAGTYALSIDGGTATCAPTDIDPDVSLDIADLGAIFLGGNSAVQRHRAGRIHGPTAAVVQLDQLFRTATAPFAPEVF